MSSFHCPHLDVLGRELIDAYRNVPDDQLFAITLNMPDNPIWTLHHAIADHRSVCPLCRSNQGIGTEEILRSYVVH